MNNLIKSSLFDIAWRIIVSLFKFILIYQICGEIALLLGFFCIAIQDWITLGDASFLSSLFAGNSDILQIFSKWVMGILDSIPFHNLFEEVIDNSNGYGSFFSQTADFLVSFGNGKFHDSFDNFLPSLLRDISRVSLSSLFFYILSRLNKLIIPKNDKPMKLAYETVCVFWLFDSYCISNLCFSLIDKYVSAENIKMYYIIVLVASFILHVFLLGRSLFLETMRSITQVKDSKIIFDLRILRVFIVFLIDMIFQIVKTYLAWIIGSNLLNIYIPTLSLNIFARSLLTAAIAAFIMVILEWLKEKLTNVITFPLFDFFWKKGIKF